MKFVLFQTLLVWKAQSLIEDCPWVTNNKIVCFSVVNWVKIEIDFHFFGCEFDFSATKKRWKSVVIGCWCFSVFMYLKSTANEKINRFHFLVLKSVLAYFVRHLIVFNRNHANGISVIKNWTKSVIDIAITN